MTRRRRLSILLVASAAAVGGFFLYQHAAAIPQPTTQPITRGDIVDAVGATGTLEAVTTVQVGTQVSGTVLELHADFNDVVRKGQVIARLDQSLFRTQVEQARASLTRAEADLDRLRLAAADAHRKLGQASQLAAKGLIPQTELDTAESNDMSSAAQVRSADAQVIQARASLNQAEVSLSKTIITAPIDGIVIARNVDVGQTVAASLQAPTLYVIAADLTKMRVNASINEADVGRVRPGQIVRFHVDAYPDDEFIGTLSLVRLSPLIQQNVVTYAGVIDVPNPDTKLRPGMTATVEVEIAARRQILRVPNTALRFRPQSSGAVSSRSKSTGVRSLLEDDIEEDVTTGQVWLSTETGLQAVSVLLGITDGTNTELVSPTLSEGTAVVTSIAGSATASAASANQITNPLMGPQRRPGSRGGGR